MAGILVEDIFDVKDIDPTGKKFERGNSACCATLVQLSSRVQTCLSLRNRAGYSRLCKKNAKRMFRAVYVTEPPV